MKKVQDHYFLKAKKENYAARSVYKLMEIQRKYRVLSLGQRVADLGCAPGSWLRFASETVGEKGFVFGIDTQSISIPPPKNAEIVQGDLESMEQEPTKTFGAKFDTVLSDMAPRFTGNANTDNAMSYELGALCLRFAKTHLKPSGSMVMKAFAGPYFGELLEIAKKQFFAVKTHKPKSSRSESKEVFLICARLR